MKKLAFYLHQFIIKISKGVLIMAQAVNVNFRLDEDVKKSMEHVCSDLGLSMSAAFTIFAKKVSREKRIPFEVSVDPFYSESNIRHLEDIATDVREGRAHFAEHNLIEVDE
jgi:DNA-damage-inducible protein J